MKALYYNNRKINPIVWDASSPEKEAAAVLALFTYLKDEWQCYDELAEPLAWDAAPSKQRKLYDAAITGNAQAAKRLLDARKDYEYEYWTFVEVEDPQSEKWTKR